MKERIKKAAEAIASGVPSLTPVAIGKYFVACGLEKSVEAAGNKFKTKASEVLGKWM